MSKINDGGPAFPGMERLIGTFSGESVDNYYTGMTLRDWFAGMALSGLLTQGYDKFNPNEFSVQAYAYADAMINARGSDD